MKNRATTVVTYCALGAIAGASFLLPSLLTVPYVDAESPPPSITLAGVARDFRSTHDDFDVTPSEGFGHYAGNVEIGLGTDGRPVLATVGGSGDPVVGGLAVAGKLSAGDPGTIFDGWDSTAGAYGGLNAGLPIAISTNGTSSNIIDLADTTVTGDVLAGPGADPGTAIKIVSCTISGTVGTLDEAVAMPVVAEPTGLGASVGDVVYNGGTSTLSTDLHCDNFYVDGGGLLWIDGAVTLLVESQLKVANASEIRLHPGATLSIYVKGDFKLENGGIVNENTGDPSRVREYHLQPGSDNIKVDGGSVLYAHVRGNGAELTVAGSQFYGTFVGGALKAQNAAGVHIDVAGLAGSGPVGAGYLVVDEWRDENAEPIAPHLYNGGGGSGIARIHADTLLDFDKTTVDSFDSRLGQYGVAGNAGSDAVVSTNSTAAGAIVVSSDSAVYGDAYAGPGGDPGVVIDDQGPISGTQDALDSIIPMPVIVEPSDAVVGPNVGDVWYKDDPFTISANMHTDGLRISNDAVVTIDGNVTILVEGDFITETQGVLVVPPDASLDIYVKGNTVIKTESAWSNPASTRLFVIGSPELKIETEAGFHGTIIAPEADLLLKTKAELFGGFIGRSLTGLTDSKIHVDLAQGVSSDACGDDIVDSAGLAGSASTGGITAVESFDEWYRDRLGVNLSRPHAITLTHQGGGVYEYLDDAFYPLDGKLFGAEGSDDHNYHFTYALATEFTYASCTGQFIELECADDGWVFIDRNLAIDLGGMRAGTPQRIELDRLGLADGGTYTMHLFFAQRQAYESVFRLRTNVLLDGGPPMTSGGTYD